jgi:hypothetical protein
MTKIYNYSVINKYLIVGKHLLTTSQVPKGYHKQPTSTSFVEVTD